MKKNHKQLLGAAVSGILLSMTVSLPAQAAGVAGECHGVNECKGKGDCGGVRSDGTKYSCSGNNECKGKGWLGMTKEECDQKGGQFKAK